MRSQDKKRILTGTVIVGLICIIIVVLTAYSAELRCENNELIDSNEALQGEIDTLNVEIKSANNIEHIEKSRRRNWEWSIRAKASVYMSAMKTPRAAISPWPSKSRHIIELCEYNSDNFIGERPDN